LSTSQWGRFHSPRVPRSLENALFSLYRLRWLRPAIIRWARALDGGTLELGLLRRIFREYHNIVIGAFSYGGCFNASRVAAGTRIGKFCSFANQVYIFATNHKLSAVTTHPFIYNPAIGIVQEDLREYNYVRIGNDVWMGQNAMIMPSVSCIGDGAVIAAGAVVTKDVEPYSVVAGVPAKTIKYRFPKEVIEALLKIQWWNWEPERIFSLYREFGSIDAFLEMAR
jgi:virginiamycin A acetyltransferase